MKPSFTREDGADIFSLLCSRKLYIRAALLFLISLGIYGYDAHKHIAQAVTEAPNADHAASDQILGQAFKNRQSNLWVTGSATVARILADDREGSRHQRFILKLASGQTLLFAHNIDLAPRINALAVGDLLHFRGEYEWNNKGGLIHWTHHDPSRRRQGGWLRHAGRIYK